MIQTEDQKVYDAIQRALDEVNEEALSNAAKVCHQQTTWALADCKRYSKNVSFITAQVKKFMLLPQDFSIPGGELGLLDYLTSFCII